MDPPSKQSPKRARHRQFGMTMLTSEYKRNCQWLKYGKTPSHTTCHLGLPKENKAKRASNRFGQKDHGGAI